MKFSKSFILNISKQIFKSKVPGSRSCRDAVNGVYFKFKLSKENITEWVYEITEWGSKL